VGTTYRWLQSGATRAWAKLGRLLCGLARCGAMAFLARDLWERQQTPSDGPKESEAGRAERMGVGCDGSGLRERS
jgi:hypothetical protein